MVSDIGFKMLNDSALDVQAPTTKESSMTESTQNTKSVRDHVVVVRPARQYMRFARTHELLILPSSHLDEFMQEVSEHITLSVTMPDCDATLPLILLPNDYSTTSTEEDIFDKVMSSYGIYASSWCIEFWPNVDWKECVARSVLTWIDHNRSIKQLPFCLFGPEERIFPSRVELINEFELNPQSWLTTNDVSMHSDTNQNTQALEQLQRQVDAMYRDLRGVAPGFYPDWQNPGYATSPGYRAAQQPFNGHLGYPSPAMYQNAADFGYGRTHRPQPFTAATRNTMNGPQTRHPGSAFRSAYSSGGQPPYQRPADHVEDSPYDNIRLAMQGGNTYGLRQDATGFERITLRHSAPVHIMQYLSEWLGERPESAYAVTLVSGMELYFFIPKLSSDHPVAQAYHAEVSEVLYDIMTPEYWAMRRFVETLGHAGSVCGVRSI